jgi:hypothetical protein
MLKPPHQRHPSSAAEAPALHRRLGLGRGAFTPLGSWSWQWGGSSTSAHRVEAALATDLSSHSQVAPLLLMSLFIQTNHKCL